MITRHTSIQYGPTAVIVLESLRKALIQIGIAVIAASIGCATASGWVLNHLKQTAVVELAAFSIPEAFLTLAQLSLTMGILICIPFIIFRMLMLLLKLSPALSLKTILGCWVAATLLFYLGVVFCLKITLPYGVQFLMSFQTTDLHPLISVRKFVSFCSIFVFGFGLIFEVPVVMVLLGRLMSIDVKAVSRHRRYAIVIITILSAILTPTPDIVNLLLMGLPLYLLFEIGLAGMRLFK